MERKLADKPTGLTCPECNTPLAEPQESTEERIHNILACLRENKKIETDLLEVVETVTRTKLPVTKQWGLVNWAVPRYYRFGEARDRMCSWNATRTYQLRTSKGYPSSIYQLNRFINPKSPRNCPKNASQWLKHFTEQVQKYHTEILDTLDHHVPNDGCVVCRNCGYTKCG